MRSPDLLPVYHVARVAVLRDPRAASAWWGLVDDLTALFRACPATYLTHTDISRTDISRTERNLAMPCAAASAFDPPTSPPLTLAEVNAAIEATLARLRAHTHDAWTGTCPACGEIGPCPTHKASYVYLNELELRQDLLLDAKHRQAGDT